MREKIGGVLLDYSLYPGEDFYSDGSVEDTLLEIVQTHAEEQYDKVILEKNDWAILYHLSSARSNIVHSLPISKQDSVLEIGSGCGAVTGALSDMCGHVTCVELSKKRSLINATRNSHRGNIDIMVGNFQDVQKALPKRYDCVTLIGVLEYAESYIKDTDNAFKSLLSAAHELVCDGGMLIVAIENRFGLKYWAGCIEDHTGAYFEGLEGYTKSAGVKTFSKPQLLQLCEESGFSSCECYYPYPDYKFPTKIYSDEHLPKPGELKDNMRNFDNERVVLFDESLVFDGLIESGMFPFFSNSYLLVLRA